MLTLDACPVGAVCDVEVTSTAGSIEQFSISGFTAAGPDLVVLALDAGRNMIATLVIDTEQQSVGCAVPTDWSCDRIFSFAASTNVTTLLFVTSGTSVIDNLRITTFDALPPKGVPEPGSLALVAGAVLSAFRFRLKAAARPT